VVAHSIGVAGVEVGVFAREDLGAADAITTVPRWTSITSKACSWRRLVVAGDASEARGIETTDATAFRAKHRKCEQDVGDIHHSIWCFVSKTSNISTATVFISCHCARPIR
jgi:hypothetical protein